MRMLTLARKYNDIFYATSTNEWEMCSKHILLFITDRLNKEQYPLEDLFDEVYTIQAGGNNLSILHQIIKLSIILPKLKYDFVTTSNIALVANLYILSRRKTQKIILLEDGLMNYKDFHTSDNPNKKAVMKILGISEDVVQSKIIKSYMLCPSRVKYSYGKIEQLVLNNTLFQEKLGMLPIINGKSVFIGQPLYSKGKMSLKDYCDMVNDLMNKYQIDYYLPHTLSSKDESVRIKGEIFDITKSKTTLELYASICTFKIFSFNSSVLYTTKLLNPRIDTFAFEIRGVVSVPKESIIGKIVSKIIEVDIK